MFQKRSRGFYNHNIYKFMQLRHDYTMRLMFFVKFTIPIGMKVHLTHIKHRWKQLNVNVASATTEIIVSSMMQPPIQISINLLASFQMHVDDSRFTRLVFKRFQGRSSGFQEVPWAFQGAFQGISGAFHRVLESSRGVPEVFYEVSETFQWVSERFRNVLGFS